MRILFLDETPDGSEAVARLVREACPEAAVLVAHDATDLRSREAAPDVILLADGAGALSRVPGLQAAWPGAALVLLARFPTVPGAVAAVRAGCVDYVPADDPAALAESLRGAARPAPESEAALRVERDRQEVILRELHHRVKNNFQMAMSLLRIRGRQAGEPVRHHFEEVAGRLAALAQIQGRLHDTPALDTVDFRGTLADLAQRLVEIHADTGVSLRLELGGALSLPAHRATTLGLLCYELMLNSLTHAFQGETGELRVALSVDGAAPEIVIADNGPGYDREAVRGGLGFTLVRALAGEAGLTVESRSTPGEGTTTRLILG